MSKKEMLSVFCSLSMASALLAVTPVTWTNVSSSSVDETQWGIPANWQDASGAELTVAPTNAADAFAVTLSELPTERESVRQMTVSTGKSKSSGTTHVMEYPAVDPSIHSVVGSMRHTIAHTVAPDDASQWQNYGGRYLTVGDPSGHAGYWMAGEPMSGFATVASDGSFTPTFMNLLTDYRVRMSVPEGAVARVENVLDGGILAKVGKGMLEIGRTMGGETSLIIEGTGSGTVKLDGAPDDGSDVAAVLAKAAVRFDASVASSFETYEGDDGRTYVSRWTDLCGSGITATKAWTHGSNPEKYEQVSHDPFLSPVKSPTGRTLLDFGSIRGDSAQSLGPTNCALQFSSVVSNVREVFCVGYRTADASTQLFGGSNSYDFHVGGSGRLFSTDYASVGTLQGDIRFNGKHVGCEYRPYSYNEIFLLSVGTTRDVTVDTIGTDRMMIGSVGGLRIGELILFTNALTRTERTILDGYLNGKWRSGDPMGRTFGGTHSSVQNMTFEVPAGHTASLGDYNCNQTAVITKTGGGKLIINSLYPENSKISIAGGEVAFGAPKAKDAPADGARYWFDAAKAGTVVTSDGGRVDKWYDCREGSTVYTASDLIRRAPNKPTLVENAYGDLPAVSTGSGSDSSWLILPHWDKTTGDSVANNTRTGFAAIRFNSASGTSANIFETGMSMAGYRTSTALLQKNYKSARGSSASWRIDGRPTLVWVSDNSLSQNERFIVVSFSDPSELGFPVQGFAADRSSTSYSYGGITFGEIILYKRQLSESERRQTEAYLMKKWSGTTHPSYVQGNTGTITFGSGVDPVLSAESDVTMSKYAGGTGAVVKKGAGHLTVSTALDKGLFKSLRMSDGGTLTISASTAAGFVLSSISGAGTLDTAKVTGTSTLAFNCSAEGVWDSVAVTGQAVLGSSLTIRLTADNVKRIPPGEYTIFSAAELSGFDASQLTLDVEEAMCKRRSYSVRQVGNSLVLTVAPHGLLLMVR